MKCPRCDGFGYLDEDGELECDMCDGAGAVPDPEPQP